MSNDAWSICGKWLETWRVGMIEERGKYLSLFKWIEGKQWHEHWRIVQSITYLLAVAAAVLFFPHRWHSCLPWLRFLFRQPSSFSSGSCVVVRNIFLSENSATWRCAKDRKNILSTYKKSLMWESALRLPACVCSSSRSIVTVCTRKIPRGRKQTTSQASLQCVCDSFCVGLGQQWVCVLITNIYVRVC